MCTAITYQTDDFYFGRNLDYEFSYGEEITITPRRYVFNFRNGKVLREHYSMIGTAYVLNDYPLYYDAVNEKGLSVAALNFVGNAEYQNKDSKNEAKELLREINFWKEPFSDELPLASLHWMIADRTGCITVESVREGVKVYDNEVGVLTNNPPFEMQLFNLNNYMGLSAKSPEINFADEIDFQVYSRGMGGVGLPGDLSSQSRFVRASFVKLNSVSGKGEEDSVNQFFHILNSVDQQRGCCELENQKYEITIYSCCFNTDKGIYYYTTYGNHRINAIDMNRENMGGKELIKYILRQSEDILYEN